MSVSYVHPPIERQRVARIRGVKKTNRRVMTFVKKKVRLCTLGKGKKGVEVRYKHRNDSIQSLSLRSRRSEV